jgi:hypothetical protein
MFVLIGISSFSYAQIAGSEAKNDQHNTYKYLKKDGKCISSTAVSIGCTDDIGLSVEQFKTVSGFSSAQYGQSEYPLSLDLDGDGISGIDVDHDGDNDKISKYSSALGFGSQKHAPVAIERPASAGSSQKYTYFVYSGPVTLDGRTTIASTAGQGNRSTSSAFNFATNKSPALGIYVSKYNPSTKQVVKPILVHAKYTDDFHDNAVINMDPSGHIYVLISGRGNSRQMLLYRSDAPYSMESFTDITPDTPNVGHKVSYPKFFWTKGQNGYFRLIYNDYDSSGNRDIWSAKISVNGSAKAIFTTEPTSTLGGYGHYVVGDARGDNIVLAFNEHSGGISKRTNLYYMYSDNGGESWKNINNQHINIPFSNSQALSSVAVKEYNDNYQQRSIYVKDIAFDSNPTNSVMPEIVVLGVVGVVGDVNDDLSVPSASYDRYFATWYRKNGAWVGARFSNQVDHNYSTAAIHQSDSSSVIYAQTLEGNENYLAGGSIAKGSLTDKDHTGNVLANNVATGYFSDATYCEFNNIRPIHTEEVESSSSVWEVATGGNPQQYVAHNPLFIVLNGGEVRQLPGSVNTNSEWLNTTATTTCNY